MCCLNHGLLAAHKLATIMAQLIIQLPTVPLGSFKISHIISCAQRTLTTMTGKNNLEQCCSHTGIHFQDILYSHLPDSENRSRILRRNPLVRPGTALLPPPPIYQRLFLDKTPSISVDRSNQKQYYNHTVLCWLGKYCSYSH